MIGKVIGVEENLVYVELIEDILTNHPLIHHYVSLESEDKIIVGEVINIKDGVAHINLVGEMQNNEFVFGVIAKPSFSSTVKLIDSSEVKKIISVENYSEDKDLYIGKSPIYDDVDVAININKFFSEHFAIFGSTGSGKSCSVARIFQNLFSKQNPLPYKASIFMFDAYGEYHSAFKSLNKVVPEISFKAYTTNIKDSESEILRIPLWLVGVDDIALLLGAEKHSQIQIIEKAMKLVTIFAKEEKEVIKSKNDIIARALLDILASGRTSTAIRDQVFSVLSYYNTSELNEYVNIRVRYMRKVVI